MTLFVLKYPKYPINPFSNLPSIFHSFAQSDGTVIRYFRVFVHKFRTKVLIIVFPNGENSNLTRMAFFRI
jgi:hypothetical protein